MSRRRFLAATGVGAGVAVVAGVGISRLLEDSTVSSSDRFASDGVVPLSLGAQTYSFADFTEESSGMTSVITSGGIVGQGSDQTVIDLTGPIRTRFPEWQTGDTSQWNVVRIQPRAGRLIRPVLSGFTLRVSAPAVAGALFNGLRIASADDLLVNDVHVIGVPGSGNLPPFETFGLDLVGCVRPVLRRVIVDGQGRGGAGIGLNTTTDALLDNCMALNNGNSHGFACFGCHRVTFVNCVSARNGKGGGRQAGAGFSHEETTQAVHLQSRATDNSLASFRFMASHGSTKEHRIIASDGDGAVLTEGFQVPEDISVQASTIAGGATHD